MGMAKYFEDDLDSIIERNIDVSLYCYAPISNVVTQSGYNHFPATKHSVKKERKVNTTTKPQCRNESCDYLWWNH